MANNSGAVPLNADKELFAEDFVFWFLNNRWNFCPHLLSRANVTNTGVSKYREFVYNGLNGTIKMAVQFIDDFLDPSVLTDFISMVNEDRVSEVTFTEYANSYKDSYFSGGFEASAFLMYCTRLANLAGQFYVRGRKDILHLTVDLIVKAFPEGDMFNGTWDTLNQAADMFVRLEEHRAGALTPSESETSTEPSESSSEGGDSSPESDFDSNEVGENERGREDSGETADYDGSSDDSGETADYDGSSEESHESEEGEPELRKGTGGCL